MSDAFRHRVCSGCYASLEPERTTTGPARYAIAGEECCRCGAMRPDGLIPYRADPRTMRCQGKIGVHAGRGEITAAGSSGIFVLLVALALAAALGCARGPGDLDEAPLDHVTGYEIKAGVEGFTIYARPEGGGEAWVTVATMKDAASPRGCVAFPDGLEVMGDGVRLQDFGRIEEGARARCEEWKAQK